jgi:hypothetical protein
MSGKNPTHIRGLFDAGSGRGRLEHYRPRHLPPSHRRRSPSQADRREGISDRSAPIALPTVKPFSDVFVQTPDTFLTADREYRHLGRLLASGQFRRVALLPRLVSRLRRKYFSTWIHRWCCKQAMALCTRIPPPHEEEEEDELILTRTVVDLHYGASFRGIREVIFIERTEVCGS